MMDRMDFDRYSFNTMERQRHFRNLLRYWSACIDWLKPDAAIQTCRDAGNNDITILKCTSQYPATIAEANLLTIPDMIERFGVKVG